MTNKQKLNLLIKILDSVFFSEDFRSDRFINNLIELSGLDISEVNSVLGKEWDKKNKEIEEKIYTSYASRTDKKELKQIIGNKQKDMSGIFKVVPSLKDLPKEDFESFFPVHKLLHYHDVFIERMVGIDPNSTDASSDKLILKSLQQKTDGLSFREVMLFYNIMKSNLIELSERKVSRTSQEKDQDAGSHADVFVEGVFKYLTDPLVADLNDGVEIKKGDIKTLITTLIKRERFNIKPYILLFGNKQSGKMSQNLLSLKEPISEFKQDSDKLFYYILLRILFKRATDDDLKSINVSSSLIDFCQNRAGVLSEKEIGVTIVIDDFMYALCSQIYEVNTTYHSSDDDRKYKLEKLYKSSTRLGMMLVNALSKGFEGSKQVTFDDATFQKILVNFLKRHKDLITQEDLFDYVYDF